MPGSGATSEFAKTVCHPITINNAIQVVGLYMNCFNICAENEVYVSTKIDLVQPSQDFVTANHDDQEWAVYSSFSRASEKEVINDIFVFYNVTQNLVMMILGARFTKVPIASLTRVLNKANRSREAPAASFAIPQVSTSPSSQQRASVLPDQGKSKLPPTGHEMCFLLSKTFSAKLSTYLKP